MIKHVKIKHRFTTVTVLLGSVKWPWTLWCNIETYITVHLFSFIEWDFWSNVINGKSLYRSKKTNKTCYFIKKNEFTAYSMRTYSSVAWFCYLVIPTLPSLDRNLQKRVPHAYLFWFWSFWNSQDLYGYHITFILNCLSSC